MAIKNLDLAALFQAAPVFTQMGGGFDANTAKSIKQKRYRQMARGINVVSYSTLESLYNCPRQFKLNKNRAAQEALLNITWNDSNIDFAYGRAFETGVQDVLMGVSEDKTFFDMMMAWDMPLDYEEERKAAKTFTRCVIAIEKFRELSEILFEDWEVLWFTHPVTGESKPAVELSMCINMENGYYFMAHMDITLRHKITGRLRVLEIKTTGNRQQQEAHYKNSGQATGYSIMLDEVAENLETSSEYEVFYLVYITSLDEFRTWEFVKTRSLRADWLNTLFFDIQQVDAYRTHNFFPKRGNACVSKFGKVCFHYGTCDLTGSGDAAIVDVEEIDMHQFDFRFDISDIIATQQKLIAAV